MIGLSKIISPRIGLYIDLTVIDNHIKSMIKNIREATKTWFKYIS